MSNKFSAKKSGRNRRNIKASSPLKKQSFTSKQPKPSRHRSIEPTSNTSSLTAFELKKEITSKQLQSDQICALTVSKNLIYIATKSGKLSIFEERANQQINKSRSNLKSHVKHKKTADFKKAKNIKQMAVNLDKNIMILVLNNGHYLCMDAMNLVEYSDKKNSLLATHKTKNAEVIISCFRRPYYRFAICSKKNIYIFEWDNSNKNYSFVREISNGEQCISCLFYNHYLCFSTHKKGFVMHDIKTGKENKINVPAMPNNIPRMYQISHHDDDYKQYKESNKDDGYLLVQASTNLGIFIDKTGNPAQKDTVNWSSTPLFVVDCKTYMVGYLDNKCIEIISLVDQKAVQLLTIYDANTMMIEEREINGLYRTLSNHVILYDSFDVFSLVPTPIQQQISECIKHLRIEKGLKLLMNDGIDPTQNELRSFQAEAGFALLCNLQWKRSMEHFEISDVDPRDIIYLFPAIKFAGFEYTIQHSSAPKNCTIDDLINKVLNYKRSQSINSNVDNIDYEEEKENEYLNGIYYLGQFLWKRRSEPSSEDFAIVGAETKLCVDTALLKIYVCLTDNRYNLINQDLSHSAPFFIEDLLDYEYENACVESECEKILISSQQYYNLALFYRSKKKLKKSLNSLYKIGKSKEWKGDVDEAINLTISILSLMRDKIDLWTYSQWILELKPELSMNIFTHSKRRNIDSKLYINFDKVLTHLNEDIIGNMDGYCEIKQFDYIQKYLEFIVSGMDNESLNPKYHDELAYLYMKKISKLNQNKVVSNVESTHNILLENIRQKLLEFLEKSQLISPSKLLQHAKNFQLYDEIIELNKKLKNHKAVLYTLVIDKKDHKSAVEYCKETAPSSKDRSDRFLELLRLYFGDRTEDKKENKSNAKRYDINDGDINDIMFESETIARHTKNSTINFDLLKSELSPENDSFSFMDAESGGGGMNFDFDELDKDINININIKESGAGDDIMAPVNENEIFEKKTVRSKRRGAISMDMDMDMDVKVNDVLYDVEEFFEYGCDILYDYAFDMDYLRVCELLPSLMDIMHFEKYIKKIVPYIVHKRRIMEIKKNLYKRQYLRQTTHLAKVKSIAIKMDYDSLCKKCQKNIGSSVFIFEPKSMRKYHYSCFYKKRQPKNKNVITNQHYIDELGNDIVHDEDRTVNSHVTITRNNINEEDNINVNKGSKINPFHIKPFNNPFANDNVSNDSTSIQEEEKKDINPFQNTNDNQSNNPFHGNNNTPQFDKTNPFG